MKLNPVRQGALVAAVNLAFDSDHATGVECLLSDLEAAGARGLETFLAKLERAVATPSEFYGTVREGVYARFIAMGGGLPSFEPKGPKGPDLGITVSGEYANVEIKRLLDGDTFDEPAELEESWANEFDEEFEPVGRDRWTDKVGSVITGAVSQLLHGEPNVVVVADWSISGTRGNFRRATRLLQAEIEANGTYSRLSAAQYDASFLSDVNRYVWINPRADVPLPDSVEGVLRRAAAERSKEENEAVVRAVTRGSARAP